jgi:glutathione peroxidase
MRARPTSHSNRAATEAEWQAEACTGAVSSRLLTPDEPEEDAMTTLYDFHAKSLDGRDVDLAQFRGKAVLVVNTASKCGFTPQYEGLEKLYEKLNAKGLTILGFPCNQFGKQEPGGPEEIGTFCQTNYGVSFPMFDKIDVNGPHAHPLYQYLKDEQAGVLGTKNIKWNFTKFLVDRNGKVVDRFAPITKPQDIEKSIEKVL